MQLSLPSTSSPASSESGDLLNLPAVATADEPASGFGDLMADLLPEAEAPADPSAVVAPVNPIASDAAAAQVAVDLMAWMVRTPPPPPVATPTADIPSDTSERVGTGETELDSEESVWTDTFANRDGEVAARAITLAGENRDRWSARDVFAAAMPLAARNEAVPAGFPAGAAPADPSAGEDAAAGVMLPMTNLRSANGAAASGVAAAPGQGVPAEPAAATAMAPESEPAPVAPGPFRLRPEPRGEKIAAGSRGFPAAIDGTDSAVEKNFLNVDKQFDADELTSVGITVAKPDIAMPALATSTSISSVRPDSGAIAALMETAGSTSEAPAMPAPVETPESIAHTAVAAVTKAVERAEAAPRTAVNLQFSIGDSDLVVRIEHRADEVRATFRTDSGELRAALSSEWQTAVSGGSEHALRRVEPVFTSASSANDERGSTDGNPSWSQQRQAGRESAGEASTPFAAFMRRSAPAVSAASTEPASATAVRSGLLPTALHLQTFA